MPPLSEIKALAQNPEELHAKFEPNTLLQTDSMAVIAGKGNLELSRRIAWFLGKDLDEPIDIFRDGEKKVQGIKQNLRKKEVFILQSGYPSPDERLMELFLMVDTARRASAQSIIPVLLYPPYMRQDHKDQSRTPISAALIPEILKKIGATALVTMDLHSDPQQGFFSGAWDTVFSSRITIPELKSRDLQDPIIASPDSGGMKRARKFSRIMGLGSNVVEGDKDRPPEQIGTTITYGYNGDVKDRDVVLVDDVIDTGGTIAGLTPMFKTDGARTIRVVAPYGLFSINDEGQKAIDVLERCSVDEIIVTNAIEAKPEAIRSPMVTYVDIAPMIAEAILCVHTGESISQRLILDPPKS